MRHKLLRLDFAKWLALGAALLSLYLHYHQIVLRRPDIEYSLTQIPQGETSGTPPMGSGFLHEQFTAAVKRPGMPGPVTVRKYGIQVHIRSVGREAASNVQTRVSALNGAYIVRIDVDDEKLVEKLPDIAAQGSQGIFVTVPLMVPDEELKLTFWYGIPGSQDRPTTPSVLVRHAEALGRLVASR